MKIIVFISGRGSNLNALLQDLNGYEISHVIANKNNIKGFEVAKNAGIPHTYINWSNSQKAEAMALEILNKHQPDLIILAGFMKILSEDFVRNFHQQIINIHPSLLPDYPGLNTHKRVLMDKKTEHGATIHYVDGFLDHGKRISQIKISVTADDTPNSLANKLIPKEHKLLTYTVGQIANNNLKWKGSDLYFNNKLLDKPIVIE